MSKLNVYHHELRPGEYDEFYLKSEADKVIAELKKERRWKAQTCLCVRGPKSASGRTPSGTSLRWTICSVVTNKGAK